MNIRLGDLKLGEYREITAEEMEELESLLSGSSNLPGKAENRKKESERKIVKDRIWKKKS